MTPAQENAAKSCLLGAENDTMTFPEIVQTLIQAGFESYAIDYRRCRAIYYLPDGQSAEYPTHPSGSLPSGSTRALFRQLSEMLNN